MGLISSSLNVQLTRIKLAVLVSQMFQKRFVQQTVPRNVVRHTNRTSYGFVLFGMILLAVLQQCCEIQLSFTTKWTTQSNLIRCDNTLSGFKETFPAHNRLHRMVRPVLGSATFHLVTFLAQIVVPANQTHVTSSFKVFTVANAASYSCVESIK